MAEIFYDYNMLFSRLEQIINEFDNPDDDLFTIFNSHEKALRDLRNELGPYIWSQTLKTMSLDDPSSAKREMLAECRACCRNNSHDLKQIDEFERTFRSDNAILWYTKPSFLHRLINKALRTEDNLVLHKFRYFIVDFCERLKQAALTSAQCTEQFRLYRGTRLGREEVNKLHIGSLVATNDFFSSSKDLLVAQEFISIDPITGMSPSSGCDDRQQYVLFQIDVNLNTSPEIIVTDISGLSTIPDEHEMVFSLGTTFTITDINYDTLHHIWYIHMISSSEVAKLIQEYNTHIQKRFIETKPIVMFGHVLSEFCSNYHGAIIYFHRLLRSKSWNDEDRPDIYHYLGRIYRAFGKNQQAMTYFRCALLLQRRNLSGSSITYGRALSCIGSIYSELGDLSRAIRLYEQAMVIYRKVLPKNHYEFGFHSNRLAQVYWLNGQYEFARDLLMNTISFNKETMPKNSPGLAQTLHCMGLVQHSLNDREQALHYFKQSLEMRQSFQAGNHPYAARTCYELSLLYEEQNDDTTALDYARKNFNNQ
ncbi:hypothetical protein I4U23_015764 [Adineta vaga]|nr:hypothetical protein I4U23_015764 [Adineta vaga]